MFIFNEIIMVKLLFKDKDVCFEHLKDNKTSLDYVLIAVILCLGHEILESENKNEFHNVHIHFGLNKIVINCECKKDFEEKFKLIVLNCYILKNLKFEKEIHFLNV